MNRVKKQIAYYCDDIVNKKYLGQGIHVVVLDTGISPHFEFQKRLLLYKDAIKGYDFPYDDNGHGTHVCGIIGGKDIGMAPECKMLVWKVLDEKGNGNVTSVMRAFRWVLENQKQYQIRIVNISVGMTSKSDAQDERRLIQGVEAMWDAGIVVVAAAGNLGPSEGTITTPGVSKKIITVGSVDNQIKNYSGRGPTDECVCKPDVVAPGSNIYSCNADYVKHRRVPYVKKSGTSMATPVVSGAIANLLSKYPDMSNVEVKLRLRESCVDLGLPRNHQGWGMLHVERLLRN